METPAPATGTPGEVSGIGDRPRAGWGGGLYEDADMGEPPPSLPRSTEGGERTAYPPQ
jgi:hypothetical protein